MKTKIRHTPKMRPVVAQSKKTSNNKTGLYFFYIWILLLFIPLVLALRLSFASIVLSGLLWLFTILLTNLMSVACISNYRFKKTDKSFENTENIRHHNKFFHSNKLRENAKNHIIWSKAYESIKYCLKVFGIWCAAIWAFIIFLWWLEVSGAINFDVLYGAFLVFSSCVLAIGTYKILENYIHYKRETKISSDVLFVKLHDTKLNYNSTKTQWDTVFVFY